MTTFYNYNLVSDMAQQRVKQLNGIPKIYDYTTDDTNGFTYKPPVQNPVNSVADAQRAMSRQNDFEDYVNNMLYNNYSTSASTTTATAYPYSRRTIPDREPFIYSTSPYWGHPENNRFTPIVSNPNWTNAENLEHKEMEELDNKIYTNEGFRLNALSNNSFRGHGPRQAITQDSQIYTNTPTPKTTEHFGELNTHADIRSIPDNANRVNVSSGGGSNNQVETFIPVPSRLLDKLDNSNSVKYVIFAIVILFVCIMLVQIYFNQKRIDLLNFANNGMNNANNGVNGGLSGGFGRFGRGRMNSRNGFNRYNDIDDMDNFNEFDDYDNYDDCNNYEYQM